MDTAEDLQQIARFNSETMTQEEMKQIYSQKNNEIKKLEAEVRHYRFSAIAMDEEIQKLKEENEKLNDDEWVIDNHKALKYKVVLEEDYYLQHLGEDQELIHPEEIDELKEENEKLKKEKDVLQKFLAGNFDWADEVKAIISRDWTKEFIENNEERWEEIGLEGGFN